MKIKIILAALACLLLSPGCISNDDSDKALATWKATTETAVAAINKEIATMKNLIAEKAPASQVNALEAKVNAGGTGNSYKKDETYTRSEIESKISAAIQALKDDSNAPWVKKTATDPTTSVVPTNSSQVATQAGGTVTMRIFTNPANALAYPGYTDPVITTAGSYTWFIQFLNTDVAYHKVYLVGNMNPTSVVNAASSGVVDNKTTSMTWTPNFSANSPKFTMIRNPNTNDTDTTQNVFFTSNSFCVLAPGQVILIPVTLNLHYVAGKSVGYYMVSFNPNVQNYP